MFRWNSITLSYVHSFFPFSISSLGSFPSSVGFLRLLQIFPRYSFPFISIHCNNIARSSISCTAAWNFHFEYFWPFPGEVVFPSSTAFLLSSIKWAYGSRYYFLDFFNDVFFFHLQLPRLTAFGFLWFLFPFFSTKGNHFFLIGLIDG